MILKKRKRLPGWAHRVHEIFQTEDRSTFEIGKNDCFTRGVKIETAMYGSSHWAKFSNYTEEESYNIRNRFRMGEAQNILDRMYQRIPREKVRLGDFTVRSRHFGVPFIYFYDGEKFRCFLPIGSPYEEDVERYPFLRFWRL